jgi:hypothetical protein
MDKGSISDTALATGDEMPGLAQSRKGAAPLSRLMPGQRQS